MNIYIFTRKSGNFTWPFRRISGHFWNGLEAKPRHVAKQRLISAGDCDSDRAGGLVRRSAKNFLKNCWLWKSTLSRAHIKKKFIARRYKLEHSKNLQKKISPINQDDTNFCTVKDTKTGSCRSLSHIQYCKRSYKHYGFTSNKRRGRFDSTSW